MPSRHADRRSEAGSDSACWRALPEFNLLKANGADIKVVQELLRHPSTRVILDRYTQAGTPAKRAAQTERLNCRRCAVIPQGGECQGCLSWSSEVCWKFVPFCAYASSDELRKLLILSWRPRRDLNPCYRRESTGSGRKLLKLGNTDGYLKQFQ
jgi:hypothetical protein